MCRCLCTKLFTLAWIVALLALLTGGNSVSFADGCPSNCSANRFNIDVQADKSEIKNGDSVNYTVTAFNDLTPFTDGCDAGVSSCDSVSGHGVIVQLCCPSPTGASYPLFDFAPGHCAELSAATIGDNFPAGSGGTLKVHPPVACVVTLNSGLTQATANAAGGDATNPNTPDPARGTIHFPAGDKGVQGSKPIPVIVDICGDGTINQTCETCDGSAFPSNAPSSHGACRTGQDTCGVIGCTFCGDGVKNGPASGPDVEECDDGNTVSGDGCEPNCKFSPCQVNITKTVAPDDGSGGGTSCDGVADGPFVESVTVDATSCVVYNICVTNTGQQVLDANGVKVDDPVLGTVNFDFGTIPVGAAPVCKQAPGVITAPNCTGGNPAGTSCTCQQVEGVNTAIISAAICEDTNQNACDQQGSHCQDTANVACLKPGSCRMTGGHNFDVVDTEFDENGKVYTTGGQIGAPNESGCCDLPPKGKCVAGNCTGGLNGGAACSTNDDCPNDPGRNSHCPWGDWEHNHHSGPDDSGSVKGGSFAFHSGTAASPNAAFIKSVLCADPGWCVQARPAPFKQIFWEGTGVFHNVKNSLNQNIPLPRFSACGANQPKPYSSKTGGTLHYYKAHVGDFGEPAGSFQKPADACVFDETCTNPGPNQVVEISRQDNVCPSTLGDVCLIEATPDQKATALHPLCLAQTCSECPDLYEIEIHCTADPASPVAYRVSHFIREGNFQLHPPVGDSCNPSCGDGVCQPGVTGTAETCATCPADCGPCP